MKQNIDKLRIDMCDIEWNTHLCIYGKYLLNLDNDSVLFLDLHKKSLISQEEKCILAWDGF